MASPKRDRSSGGDQDSSNQQEAATESGRGAGEVGSQQSASSSGSSSQQSEGPPAIPLEVLQEVIPVTEEDTEPLRLSQESLESVDESTLRLLSPLKSPQKYRKSSRRRTKSTPEEVKGQGQQVRRSLRFEREEDPFMSGATSVTTATTAPLFVTMPSVTLQYSSTSVTSLPSPRGSRSLRSSSVHVPTAEHLLSTTTWATVPATPIPVTVSHQTAGESSPEKSKSPKTSPGSSKRMGRKRKAAPSAAAGSARQLEEQQQQQQQQELLSTPGSAATQRVSRELSVTSVAQRTRSRSRSRGAGGRVRATRLQPIAPAPPTGPPAPVDPSLSVRAQLKGAIKRRREQPPGTLSPSGAKQMSEQKLAEKKARRREQNKRAAQKSRERKRDWGQGLIKDYQRLQSSNTSLRYQISQLQKEKSQLADILSDHMQSCNLQVPTSVLPPVSTPSSATLGTTQPSASILPSTAGVLGQAANGTAPQQPVTTGHGQYQSQVLPLPGPSSSAQSTQGHVTFSSTLVTLPLEGAGLSTSTVSEGYVGQYPLEMPSSSEEEETTSSEDSDDLTTR